MSAPSASSSSQQPPKLLDGFRDVKTVLRSNVPDSVETVLLGECTHGTQEFYTQRAEITKYLIEVRKFKVVLIEADWPFCWHISMYIHRKKLEMFPKDCRFPEWMWRNRPFVELIYAVTK